jgi:hypothetical protein
VRGFYPSNPQGARYVIGTSCGWPPDEKTYPAMKESLRRLFLENAFWESFSWGWEGTDQELMFLEVFSHADFRRCHPWKRPGSPLKTPTHKKETRP